MPLSKPFRPGFRSATCLTGTVLVLLMPGIAQADVTCFDNSNPATCTGSPPNTTGYSVTAGNGGGGSNASVAGDAGSGSGGGSGHDVEVDFNSGLISTNGAEGLYGETTAGNGGNGGSVVGLGGDGGDGGGGGGGGTATVINNATISNISAPASSG
jgi:hypothetical protein